MESAPEIAYDGSTNMAHEFRTQRRVEFSETDCAGIIHFSNYYRYMEEAEHAFLRSLGLSVQAIVEEGEIGFPRLSASCRFLRTAKFEDVLDIHLRVSRKGHSSIKYTVFFLKDGEEVARGEITCVACLRLPDRTFKPIPLPEPFVSLIEEAPPHSEDGQPSPT